MGHAIHCFINVLTSREENGLNRVTRTGRVSTVSYRSALTLPDSVEHRELFELVGPGYRLPAWLEKTTEELKPDSRVIVSLPLMPWLPKQRTLMDQTFGRLCVRRAELGWVLTWEQASACLSKSDHSEPADVVVWNPAEAKEEQSDSGPRSFVQEYCRHRDAIHRDPATVAILWASFQKVAFWWLLNRTAPLDLGFVKLQTLPVRRDWFKVLWCKWRPAIGHASFSMTRLIQKCGPDLTAWDERHQVIRWTIEAEPTDKFHETMRGIEQERKRSIPSAKRYATKIADLLKLYAKRITDAFEATLAEKAVKVAPIRRGAAGKAAGYFKPKPKPAEAVVDDAGDALDRGERVVAAVEARAEEFVESANASVSEVRNFQHGDVDVRDARAHMASPRNSPAEVQSVGLPVLHAAESETEGELLSVRCSAGLDASDALATRNEFAPHPVSEQGG